MTPNPKESVTWKAEIVRKIEINISKLWEI
jgi:hypothetical protein